MFATHFYNYSTTISIDWLFPSAIRHYFDFKILWLTALYVRCISQNISMNTKKRSELFFAWGVCKVVWQNISNFYTRVKCKDLPEIWKSARKLGGCKLRPLCSVNLSIKENGCFFLKLSVKLNFLEISSEKVSYKDKIIWFFEWVAHKKMESS